MKKEKLYAIAIFALKPDPEHTVSQNADGSFRTSYQSTAGDVEYNTSPGIGVSYDLAASEDEAREAGLRKAKEMFPESEGWTVHAANAVEIESAAIMDAAALLEAEYRPAPDEEEREM